MPRISRAADARRGRILLSIAIAFRDTMAAMASLTRRATATPDRRHRARRPDPPSRLRRRSRAAPSPSSRDAGRDAARPARAAPPRSTSSASPTSGCSPSSSGGSPVARGPVRGGRRSCTVRPESRTVVSSAPAALRARRRGHGRGDRTRRRRRRAACATPCTIAAAHAGHASPESAAGSRRRARARRHRAHPRRRRRPCSASALPPLARENPAGRLRTQPRDRCAAWPKQSATTPRRVHLDAGSGGCCVRIAAAP